jgi:cytoskeletal protein CcmA (bactofilin family)
LLEYLIPADNQRGDTQLTTQLAEEQRAAKTESGRVHAFLRKVSAGPRREASGQSASNAQDAAEKVLSSTISSDFTITGNISCKGEAQFDGELNGNIECHHLVVGKNGRVVGDIRAEDVIIYGKVEGAIHCQRITLKSGSNVSGDILHQGIAIEMGASFQGRSDRLKSEAEALTIVAANSPDSTRSLSPIAAAARKS